eukprot:TRINITY_DN47499_c0_g1_i1.p1 TRINITY_DN47499_c0_g1~~TRINITY_DN47499_c0_g1_i1.p1  ORF type:complete len:392 (+),score=73.41 TRINITY_DN47499_c0_g1_i1:29-1177(+)
MISLSMPILVFIAFVVPSLALDPPPFFEISASNLYDAGLQQGRLASGKIHAWIASPEMKSVLGFTQGKGRDVFSELKRVNSQAFPQFAEEIRGIAEGAALDLDSLWAANLIAELEGFMDANQTGHCSDIYAVPEGGFANGFSHGHNEDWKGVVKELWYFVKIIAVNGANFSSCAGMAYPGTLIGWAATWNAHGLYLTQNSLFPHSVRPDGLASVFVQREAICGSSKGSDIDEVVGSIVSKPWSYGASVNLIDLHARRLVNVEVFQDRHAVYEVIEAMGNYSHFNMYKSLLPGELDPQEASTLHRQARADALPAPRDRRAVMAILSDAEDREYPIYRDETLATLVLDGLTGVLDVWSGHAAIQGATVYSWNLLTFFQERAFQI